ncbi:MAG: nucleotidyltransferase domain-containing protein [Planctomycetes bacterium]|nr:nucleotidyltransferase domain-containing protein [Planctomycetota bacterium]
MTMEDAPQAAIESQLACIECENDVRILLAVESGSRSWGFESPDSDYDVRFIYAHRKEWYLSIREKRDVIELPFDGQLDICGWDLRKTLGLFQKSNPVLMEWIVSPFVYLESGSFAKRIRELARKYYSRKAGAHHYLSMAENNHKSYIENRDEVNLKKYLYVLRPLINILWLSEKKDLIPMVFCETLNAVTVPGTTRDAIYALLDTKMAISELGTGKRIAIIDAFIEDTMVRAKAYCDIAPVSRIPIDVVDDLFQVILNEVWL